MAKIPNSVVRTTISLLMALAWCACDVPTDVLMNDGGQAPDPRGVMEGSITYIGPRPQCVRDLDANPTRVVGRVILLLFNYDNPPPPSGTATSAANILVVPSNGMFELTDCMPLEGDPAPITRTAPFIWPELALGSGETNADGTLPTADYQVRGFYDSDEDFTPFFSVRRSPTMGDVAGGAFENILATPRQYLRVQFGHESAHPDGQVVNGITVTLAATVNTEVPIFERGAESFALSSESVLPATPDNVMREEQLWQLTQFRLTIPDITQASWQNTLNSAGMHVSNAPWARGFYILDVDANSDGMTDLHPVLGPTAGIVWQFPVVLLRRATSTLEAQFGIPAVTLLGTVRPTQTLSQASFSPSIDIAIPPVASVNLDPSRPECSIPYIAPGNLAETYTRIPVDCQEIPTGDYDITVLSGVAGGIPTDYRAQLQSEIPGLPDSLLNSLVAERTDNGWLYQGGQFSSQNWSIPNELGCPDRAYNPLEVSQLEADPNTTCEGATETVMLRSQGPAGRFSIVDPTPDNNPMQADGTDGHGVTSCQMAISAETMMMVEVQYMPIPSGCCDAVQHLCGVPLCSAYNESTLAGSGGEQAVRQMLPANEARYRNTESNDSRVPNCVPFLMPAACCGTASDSAP